MPGGRASAVAKPPGRLSHTVFEIVVKKWKGPREYGALPDFCGLVAMVK
jgi:hypothetical protein